MKNKRPIPMSEESDSDDDTSNNGIFSDVEFRFMLKDPNTIFSALSKFIDQNKEATPECNIVLEYCKSSPECKEIVSLLDRIETRKPTEVFLIFTVLEAILLRIASVDRELNRDADKLSALGRDLCSRLLNTVVPTFYRMLNTRNRSQHIKSALQLLTAMVVQSDDIALNVQIQFDFKNKSLLPLLDRIDIKDIKDIRTCLITLIIALLVTDNAIVISNVLAVKGLIPQIFNRIHSDKFTTIMLLLPILLDKVIKNKSVSKTIKMQIFGEYSLQNISKLFMWTSALKFNKSDVKKLGKRNQNGESVDQIDVWAVEEESEDQKEIFELVALFLTELCCSFKNGIVFRDKPFTKSNCNPVITSLLLGLPRPHSRPIVGDLITKILRTSPNQLQRYLPSLSDSVVPRRSQNWFSFIDFLEKIFEGDDLDKFWKHHATAAQDADKIVEFTKTLYVPPRELWSLIVQGIQNSDYQLRYRCLKFTNSVMKKFHQILIDSSKDECFDAIRADIEIGLTNEISKIFPSAHTVFTSWEIIHSAQQDQTDLKIEDVDCTDYLGLVMDVLANYNVGASVSSFNIDFTTFYDSICSTVDNQFQESDEKLKIEKRMTLQKKLLRLISTSRNSKAFSLTKVGKNGKTSLRLLLEMFAENLNTDASIEKLLVDNNVFGNCLSSEPSIWLRNLSTFKVGERSNSVVLEFIEKCMLKSVKNISMFCDLVVASASRPEAPSSGSIKLDIGSKEKRELAQNLKDFHINSFNSNEYSSERLPFSSVLMSCLDSKVKDAKQLLEIEEYLENVIRELLRIQKFPNILSNVIVERLLDESKEKCEFPLANKYKTSRLSSLLVVFVDNLKSKQALMKVSTKCKKFSSENIFDFVENNYSLKKSSSGNLPDNLQLSCNVTDLYNQIVNYFKICLKTGTVVNYNYFDIIMKSFELSTNKISDLNSILDEKFTQKYFLNFESESTRKYVIRHSSFVNDLFRLVNDSAKVDAAFYIEALKSAVFDHNKIISDGEHWFDFDGILKFGKDSRVYPQIAVGCLQNEQNMTSKSVITVTARIFLECVRKICENSPFLGNLRLVKGLMSLLEHTHEKSVKYVILKVLTVLIKRRPLFSLSIRKFNELFDNPLNDNEDGILESLAHHNKHFSRWILNKSGQGNWISDRRYFNCINILLGDPEIGAEFSKNCGPLKQQYLEVFKNGKKDKIDNERILSFLGKLITMDTHDERVQMCAGLYESITKSTQVSKSQFDLCVSLMSTLVQRDSIYKGKQFMLCLDVLVKSKMKKNGYFVDHLLSHTHSALENLSDEEYAPLNNEIGNMWQPILKCILKSYMQCPEAIRLLVALVKRISPRERTDDATYTSNIQRDQVINLPSTYDQLIGCGHYLTTMLPDVADDNDEDQRPLVKEALVLLMIEIIRRRPILCCEEKHLPVLWSAYTATMSLTDQTLLAMLYIYEVKANCKMNVLKPYVFGKEAYERYVLNAGDTKTLWKTEHISISLLDPVKMQATAANFPLKRVLKVNENEPYTKVENGDKFYDLCFILPLINHIIAKERQVNARVFVSSGCLAVVLSSLASHDSTVRSVASYALFRFSEHLAEDHRTSERTQLKQLIEIVKNSMGKRDIKLSSTVSTFYCRFADITNKCTNPMYIKLNSFLMLKPFIDITSIPEFYILFNSSSSEYKQERTWMLTMLDESMRDIHDYRTMKKLYAFKLLMSFYSCPFADVGNKKSILSILRKACEIKTAALELIKTHGLVNWISSTINKSSSITTQGILSMLVSLLETIWRVTLQNRTSDIDSIRGLPQDELIELRTQCLPSIFLSTIILNQLRVLDRLHENKIHLTGETMRSFTSTLLSSLRHQRFMSYVFGNDKMNDVSLSLKSFDRLTHLVDSSSTASGDCVKDLLSIVECVSISSEDGVILSTSALPWLRNAVVDTSSHFVAVTTWLRRNCKENADVSRMLSTNQMFASVTDTYADLTAKEGSVDLKNRLCLDGLLSTLQNSDRVTDSEYEIYFNSE